MAADGRVAAELTMALGDLVRWMREATGLAHAERVAAAQRDPWRRFALEPPLRAFGPGAEDFRGYLTRHSRVEARTPQAVARWLLGCRYAEDTHLLDAHDHWLHPATFELVRSGDCEDFALWAWRKLVESGHDAAFVVGVRTVPGAPRGRHAWVTYLDQGEHFLLDAVERTLERIIRPVSEVQDHYEPQVGVGRDCQRHVYAGLYRESWGRQLRLQRVRGSGA